MDKSNNQFDQKQKGYTRRACQIIKETWQQKSRMTNPIF